MARLRWRETLLSAASTLNTAAYANESDLGSAEYVTVYAVYSAGTTAGTIVVEGSHDRDYTGTWAQLASLPWNGASSVRIASIAGNHIALRVRVAVAVAGGTVDVLVTISV